MQTSISKKIPVEIVSTESAFFKLTFFPRTRKKAEKGVFPMPAIGCNHRLCPLSWLTQRGLSRMAHSAAVCSGHHRTTDNCKTAHRRPTWATSAHGSLRPIRSQSRNLMNPYRKLNYGLKTSKVPGRESCYEWS